MNSRPLLDYLADSDDAPEPSWAEPVIHERQADPLEARLKDLEARLRANQPAPAAPAQDLTLSAQIEAILKRKAAHQPSVVQAMAPRHVAAQHDIVEQPSRPARIVIDPPPSVPVSRDAPAIDQDFLKFSEAVYLIGQAARRFIDEPPSRAEPPPAPRDMVAAPSTGDIEALSAALRETVSVFRSVADDLAVSAGEIRNYATRREREPERRVQPARDRDEDEILELRQTIADLQDRLDDLLQTRRRARY